MKKRIVIADDEPITRMDIREILEEAGYDVVGQASDGFDAIELCKKFKPNLVLMDVKMPLLNGMKAAKVIKEKDLADCIALLTAYSSKEFVEEAKEIGIMAYIVKPIDERNLLPAIEVALAQSEEIQKIKGDIEKTKEKLEARKLIEKAKGILVKNHRISEDEAYNKIRKLSMDKRHPMQMIAHAIIMNNGL
ncbi:ANTAR domain-containing response regulator [Inediibacterium massiliense]|uniref:ANTAR domain-containing response regulator n=1 Tax=Inediibacterium massiliense TaxID=1658111 RepID=UPI0006B5CDC8|nr:response regulator [Inediibacterium massiliense]